ncbi:hypothetical protein [Pseudomonas costantinii]|uniref:5'-nucleotidase n=1 Tax=Pseudomonas costantinii TaxID=168469 RepID=A0A1H5AYE9_9PSED|nr:hypothetical protein [Pseudomonas costantinii]SED47499.1 5'-nucleotidase [Pseudomonas costantinii]
MKRRTQGHNVKIAAPQSDQSAHGGAFLFGREITVGQALGWQKR